jgi:EpsI family protein
MDIAYYGRPRIGATMHSPLNCLPGHGWEISNVSEKAIAGAGTTWPVRQLTVTRADQSYTLLYWFQSRTRISSNEVSSRMYMLADTLRRRSTENSLVRVFVPSELVRTDPSMLTRFAARLIPEIATRLH